ncbi:MAG: biotin/lipoyl-binding protein [Gammaproteobacteria bacterium SHHR-1]|uniref:efflux RND transporter periplasmic adaptor subunit n=1 Tax=Magnetovirga frankeli TaxID=947516 RepID=UPI0012940216|nr:biotin/lipoyl-binding protein [gamma proteobacterium SS-5]
MKRPLNSPLIYAILLLLLGPGSKSWAAEAEGQVHWHESRQLGFLVDGVIAEIPVRPGQRVAQGSPLARLDGRTYQAALNAAEQRLAARQLALGEAQRELDRALELYDRGQLPEHDKQLAQIAQALAQAQLAQAQAEQVRAAFRLQQSELRAPFDALILQLHAHPGQALRGHCGPQAVLGLAAAGQGIARLRLTPEQTPPELGQQVELSLAGRQIQGQAQALRRDAENGTRLDVLFSLPPETALQPGQAVQGRW